MAETRTRLRDAQQALELLEIQIEQHRFHFEGLVAQPHEAERALRTLEKAIRELALQRTYCDLLTAGDERVSAKNGSLRVA
jgi:hypothetical protein